MNLRVALRSLWRSPGFTAMAVLTLVLGIGAVSAMFSVVNSVLIKPLAGFETERLVRVSEKFPNGYGYGRARTYREWRKLTDIFDEVGARTYCAPNMTGLGEPQQLFGWCVTPSWFKVLRAQAILGRTFLPDEDQPGHAQIAVLDYGLWIRRFGGDRSLIGRQINLDGKPYVVVGVMPKDFQPLGKGQADLYLPSVIANDLAGLSVTGRLRTGVSIERVREALGAVEAQMMHAAPKDYTGVVPQVEPLLETMIAPARDLLRLLLAASALVLLVACVNVANLFLARAAAKRRETQIRAWLGANARQLLMPALAESAIISLAGACLGLLAAWAATRILVARLENFPRVQEIAVDSRVALVTLLISGLTVFACSLAPQAFKKRITGRVLVVAEVALSFVLLICSGLLIRSFAAMRQVDLGYNPSGVVLGVIAQPADPHDQRDSAVALWRRVRERTARLPGVAAVSTTTGTPAGGVGMSFPIVLEGDDPSKATRTDQPAASAVIVSGEYFTVAGIPLRSGRFFHEHDSAQAPAVVIVSQSIADRYFGGNAVGRRLQLPTTDFNVTSTSAATLHEIVGVVGDVRQRSVQEAGRMTLYLPEGQNAVRYTSIVARIRSGDPMRLEQSIRHALYEEAPTLAMAPMLSLDSAGAYLTRAPLRAMWLLSVFAGLALLMASVGVHGVVAYATTQRAREMGIRMALGARPGQLFALVTRQAMTMAVAGAAIGLVAAYAATRLLQSLLFGVGRTDPSTYGSAVLILLIVAATSSFTSALRAARTDPSITLRTE